MKTYLDLLGAVLFLAAGFMAGSGLTQYRHDYEAEKLHRKQVLDSLHVVITQTKQLYIIKKNENKKTSY